VGEISYPLALRYAALLCLVESSIVLLATFVAFGFPNSAGELRLLALFLGAATVIRLLCNSPVTAAAFVRAAPWLQRGTRMRTALLNASVYLAGLAAVALPAVASGVSLSEIPPLYFGFVGACLASPFILWSVYPFGRYRSLAEHAAQQGAAADRA
jgi:hypothetical protein